MVRASTATDRVVGSIGYGDYVSTSGYGYFGYPGYEDISNVININLLN